jgi:hypothetical protein
MESVPAAKAVDSETTIEATEVSLTPTSARVAEPMRVVPDRNSTVPVGYAS